MPCQSFDYRKDLHEIAKQLKLINQNLELINLRLQKQDFQRQLDAQNKYIDSTLNLGGINEN